MNVRPHPFEICHQCATPEEMRVKVYSQQNGQGACKICGKIETATRTGNSDGQTMPTKSRIKHWVDIATVSVIATLVLLFFLVSFSMSIYGYYKFFQR